MGSCYDGTNGGQGTTYIRAAGTYRNKTASVGQGLRCNAESSRTRYPLSIEGHVSSNVSKTIRKRSRPPCKHSKRPRNKLEIKATTAVPSDNRFTFEGSERSPVTSRYLTTGRGNKHKGARTPSVPALSQAQPAGLATPVGSGLAYLSLVFLVPFGISVGV
jgi:hypothetical protein